MFPASKKEILQDRAHMLSQVRSFFSHRSVMEVDCPALIPAPTIDPHLHPFQVEGEKETLYLHTSPEFAMKRLLCEGIGDIYQLGHVFRKGDCGKLHQPEFMMIEWYRLDLSLSELIQECCDLIHLFLGKLKIELLPYQEAFLKFTNVDPFADQIPTIHGWDLHTTLDYFWATEVEPHLGKTQLTVITDFPPWQAQLAQVKEGKAQRFEIYSQGVELANGYDELCDAPLQRKRFLEANLLRENPLPIDELFLQALEKQGLPNCCGVAVGFDRLMHLRHQTDWIGEILPFATLFNS